LVTGKHLSLCKFEGLIVSDHYLAVY
jgi:hypothetical protein